MITKTFTYTYPNEPWNPSVSEGKTVDVTWTGTRYHIISVVEATGEVFSIEGSHDVKKELEDDLPNHVHEGHKFYLVDANDHPEAIALLQGDDTIPAKDETGGIPDYKFETPGDDEDYVYEYRTQNFMQSIHNGASSMKYDGTKFTMPGYQEHPIDKASLFDGYDAEAARIDDALSDRPENFTAAQKTEMQAVSAWLKTVRSNYASIDAWKIPHKQISFTWE